MIRVSDTHIRLYDDQEKPVLLDFMVGETVRDDLTGKLSNIVRFSFGPNGTIGIWLDSDYLEGGRHPWEISKP